MAATSNSNLKGVLSNQQSSRLRATALSPAKRKAAIAEFQKLPIPQQKKLQQLAKTRSKLKDADAKLFRDSLMKIINKVNPQRKAPTTGGNKGGNKSNYEADKAALTAMQKKVKAFAKKFIALRDARNKRTAALYNALKAAQKSKNRAAIARAKAAYDANTKKLKDPNSEFNKMDKQRLPQRHKLVDMTIAFNNKYKTQINNSNKSGDNKDNVHAAAIKSLNIQIAGLARKITPLNRAKNAQVRKLQAAVKASKTAAARKAANSKLSNFLKAQRKPTTQLNKLQTQLRNLQARLKKLTAGGANKANNKANNKAAEIKSLNARIASYKKRIADMEKKNKARLATFARQLKTARSAAAKKRIEASRKRFLAPLTRLKAALAALQKRLKALTVEGNKCKWEVSMVHGMVKKVCVRKATAAENAKHSKTMAANKHYVDSLKWRMLQARKGIDGGYDKLDQIYHERRAVNKLIAFKQAEKHHGPLFKAREMAKLRKEVRSHQRQKNEVLDELKQLREKMAKAAQARKKRREAAKKKNKAKLDHMSNLLTKFKSLLAKMKAKRKENAQRRDRIKSRLDSIEAILKKRRHQRTEKRVQQLEKQRDSWKKRFNREHGFNSDQKKANIRLQNQLKGLQAAIRNRDQQRINHVKAQASKRHAALKNSNAALRQRAKQDRDNLKAANHHVQKLLGLNKDLAKRNQNLQAIIRKGNKAAADREQLKQDIKKLTLKLEGLRSTKNDLEKAISDLTDQKTQLANSVTGLQSAVASLTTQKDGLDTQIANKNTELAGIKSDIVTQNQLKATAESDKREADNQASLAQQAAQQAAQQQKTAETDRDNAIAAKNRAEEARDTALNEEKAAATKLKQTKEELDELTDSFNELKPKVDAMDKRIADSVKLKNAANAAAARQTATEKAADAAKAARSNVCRVVRSRAQRGICNTARSNYEGKAKAARDASVAYVNAAKAYQTQEAPKQQDLNHAKSHVSKANSAKHRVHRKFPSPYTVAKNKVVNARTNQQRTEADAMRNKRDGRKKSMAMQAADAFVSAANTFKRMRHPNSVAAKQANDWYSQATAARSRLQKAFAPPRRPATPPRRPAPRGPAPRGPAPLAKLNNKQIEEMVVKAVSNPHVSSAFSLSDKMKLFQLKSNKAVQQKGIAEFQKLPVATQHKLKGMAYTKRPLSRSDKSYFKNTVMGVVNRATAKRPSSRPRISIPKISIPRISLGRFGRRP